jgi:hypothetical protein
MSSDQLHREQGLPQFDLATENEILKLKLKMEFGAECTSEAKGIPDAVVNEFLRSVYAFEQMFRTRRKRVAIFERLGSPFFSHEHTLSDVQVHNELGRLLQVMKKHRLQLDVLGAYPEREIYRFITEEFFRMEMEDVDMPGFIHHFCYEDFHPNHELEIKERVLELLTMWFNRAFSIEEWPMKKELSSQSGIRLTQRHVLSRMADVWNSYQGFENCEYQVINTCVDAEQHNKKGRAMLNGNVRFDAILESSEKIHIEGPFDVELEYTGSHWVVSYFNLPVLRW